MGDGTRNELPRYIPSEEIKQKSLHCVNLVNSVIDGESGVSEETLKMVGEYGRNCRVYCESMGDVERFKTSKNFKFLKKEEKQLAIDNFNNFKIEIQDSGMSNDEVYVEGQLLQAIKATLDFVNVMNTPSNQLRKLGDRLAPNELSLAANANRCFTVFFMEIQQKYDLNKDELASVFNSIFGNTNLRQELDTVGEENTFPGGVWAVMESYFFLKEQSENEKWGDGFFYVPPIKDDISCAVDLGWISLEPGGVNKVCQIKGITNARGVKVIPLNEVRFETENESRKYNRSLNNIRMYEQANQPVEALWVTAPSRT